MSIEKPFINICLTQGGTIYNEAGIDRRYSTLQEAVNNFGKDKADIIANNSYTGRDTTRWYIAKLEVEATVAKKESHNFEALRLAPPEPIASEWDEETPL